jgi:hypothetical protein
MEAELFEVHWRRRAILVCASGIIATLFGIGLSIALAHPAGAATLPLPAAPTLPALPVTPPVPGTPAGPVTVPGIVGAAGTLSPNVVTAAAGSTGGGAPSLPTVVPSLPLPTVPLPTHLPIVNLPIPTLPAPLLPVTMPISHPNTTAGSPGTTGLAPGTGGPAHASTGHGSSARGTRSTDRRSARSSAPATPGSPVRSPGHGLPSPSLPVVPGMAGDASAPAHGNSPGNALPLAILLLGVLAVGAVFLKRRFAPTLAFESRFAPPG